MGRYFNGDINGKFMFGVQDSKTAKRFGGKCIEEPDLILYYFNKNDLENVEKELKHIEDTIGKNNMNKIDEYFANTSFYDNNKMKEAKMLGIWNKHKANYADYKLGIKIRDCIKEQGYCEFTAELY